MPSRMLIGLMLAACVTLAAGDLYAQTTQPAPPLEGEELTSTTKPAAETPAGAEQPPPEPAKEAPPSRSPFDRWLLPAMIGVLLLLLFWSSRSRKKQEAKRQQMLAALKKGDKVTSIGGVVGTIIEVRDDEVVVKVDETNNVRVRFARWAIRGTGEQAKTVAPEERK